MALKTKASVSAGTALELLEADVYDAIFAGVVVRPFQVYEGKPGEVQDKYIFIYQIPMEGDAAPRYLKSSPLAITINEKSNLYAKHLKALTGKTDAELGNDFDPSTLLGKQIRLEVSQVKSKKDGKTYNEVEKAMTGSKVKITLEKGTLPEFFVKGATEYEFAPGIKTDDDGPVAGDTAAPLDMEALVSSVTDAAPRQRPAPIQ